MEKKKKYLLVIGILIIFLGVIGLTYAYWTITLKQKDTNVVYSTCLKLNFEDENEINLQKAHPMDENEKLEFYETTTPYHFTIENVCDMDAELSINLESIPVKEGQKQLSDEWIDVELFDGGIKASKENVIYNKSRKLTENPVNDSKLIENAKEAYNLYNLTIKSKETKEFNMLLYLDDNTPSEPEMMNASWIGKVTINAVQKVSTEPKGMLRKLEKTIVVDEDCVSDLGDIELCSYESTVQKGMWKYKEQITQIIFENKLDPNAHKEAGVISSDESALEDQSVMSYLVPTEETVQVWNEETEENINKPAYIAYIQGDGEIKGNPDSSSLFDDFKNVTNIEGMDYFNTSQVTNMSGMFRGMESLTSLNLGDQFNTSNVTDMNQMFAYMYDLTSLNLGNHFDTSNVEDMSSMFSNMQALTSLDLGDQFNTSNVTDMGGMFSQMTSLTELDLTLYDFDTSQVTDMSNMFGGMELLTSLNLGNQFNTSNVTDMSFMFSYMTNINKIEYGELFIHNPDVDIYYMFGITNSNVNKPTGNGWDGVWT